DRVHIALDGGAARLRPGGHVKIRITAVPGARRSASAVLVVVAPENASGYSLLRLGVVQELLRGQALAVVLLRPARDVEVHDLVLAVGAVPIDPYTYGAVPTVGLLLRDGGEELLERRLCHYCPPLPTSPMSRRTLSPVVMTEFWARSVL